MYHYQHEDTYSFLKVKRNASTQENCDRRWRQSSHTSKGMARLQQEEVWPRDQRGSDGGIKPITHHLPGAAYWPGEEAMTETKDVIAELRKIVENALALLRGGKAKNDQAGS